MKVRGFKRVAAGVAAASALALGAGVVAPGVAMAAEGDDPVVTEDDGGLLNPILEVTQDGYDVTVNITNPNPASYLIDGSTCTPVLISGPGLMETGFLFLQQDFLALAKKALTPNQSDFKIGTPAINLTPNIITGDENLATETTTWKNLNPNIYLLAGICTDASTLIGNFDTVSFDAEPVIVPGGIGDFGSLEALGGLTKIFG